MWPGSGAGGVEVSQDGSVTVTARNNTASLVLSPHRSDFTVCYLSPLSCEKQRSCTTKRCFGDPRIKTRGAGRLVNIQNKHKKENVSHSVKQDGVANSQRTTCVTPDNITHPAYDADKVNNELDLSPISAASGASSPGNHSADSGSPLSLHGAAQHGATFPPFSTPTGALEQPVGYSQQCNAEGSFLGEPTVGNRRPPNPDHYFQHIETRASTHAGQHECQSESPTQAGDRASPLVNQGDELGDVTLVGRGEDDVCGTISPYTADTG